MRYWLPAILIPPAPPHTPRMSKTSRIPVADRAEVRTSCSAGHRTFGVRGRSSAAPAATGIDFVTDRSTIDDGAFNAPGVTLEVGFRQRLDWMWLPESTSRHVD